MNPVNKAFLISAGPYKKDLYLDLPHLWSIQATNQTEVTVPLPQSEMKSLGPLVRPRTPRHRQTAPSRFTDDAPNPSRFSNDLVSTHLLTIDN